MAACDPGWPVEVPKSALRESYSVYVYLTIILGQKTAPDRVIHPVLLHTLGSRHGRRPLGEQPRDVGRRELVPLPTKLATHPGDGGDADGWTRACALFDTLTPEELLDWPRTTLLHRLFHEEAPELLADKPLQFGCSCSRERVEAMLQSLGQEEAEAALADGVARVRCEFCGQGYSFTPGEIEALFTEPPQASVPAPERMQ